MDSYWRMPYSRRESDRTQDRRGMQSDSANHHKRREINPLACDHYQVIRIASTTQEQVGQLGPLLETPCSALV